MRYCAFFRKGVRMKGGFFMVFALWVFTAKSQSTNLKYLGIEKGLSNNSVRAIYQDHNGFLWFGTYDGLNRYDGYEFTVFRNKLDDSTSLPYNYINTITEDKQQNLWVGTGQGIGIYNSLSAKWQAAYFFRYGRTVKEKLSDNINQIETDAAGNVLIGTANNGLLIRPNGKDAAVQVPFNRNGQDVTAYHVQAMKMDRKERVWLLVEEVGLCVYDEQTRKVRVVNAAQRSIQCLQVVNDQLWLGTKNGLFVYDIASNKTSRLQTKKGTKLASLNITSLYLDKQQKMWIGTEGDGVLIVNTVTGDLASIQPGSEGTNMTSGSVNVIFEDRETRKWIGTLKGGINIIDPEETKFQTIAHGQRNPNSLVNDFVYSFYEDRDRNLWIGTDGGGFSIWNRKKNKFTNYWHDEKLPQSLSNNAVTGILQDHLNNTWIATFGGGINKFNQTTGQFEHYPCINDRTGEVDKIVMVLYEDREKQLWAGTFSNGKLYRFNRAGNRFEVFDQNLANLLTIAEDRNGELWLGNTSQLIRLDKQQKRHQVFAFNKPVRAIHEDKIGNFWVGTEGGGLILFDRKEGKIKRRFSVENGLCNNSILKILEDDNGQLWLSTFNGLSKFNPGENTFKNYYQS
ncbi:MAG: hybrid sensor histidine kinase/response regulator, partial [Chitinophagaceae bacterium]